MVFLIARLHHPVQATTMTTMMILGGVLAFCNAAACLFNIRIKSPGTQRALGISMLIVDTLITWGIILLFVRDFYTAAYAGFVYVILEAATRFGLIGSLSMIAVFALGLYGAYEYRLAVFSVRFSNSGYAFWTTLMSILAVCAGAIVHMGRTQRRQNEDYLRETTVLVERHRIARELHDTVLKTLQGLSLEARALKNRTTGTIKDTAQYIEEVCSRTSQEIREVIFDLHTEDERTGIGSQISKILNEWSRATGITSEFKLSGSDVTLSTETNHQLQHIISEALTNVERHAQASLVYIAIEISSSEVNIEIRDDGRGLGCKQDDIGIFLTEGKLGLAGMKERIEVLGGSLSIDGTKNGTVINVKFPLVQQFKPEQ